MPVFAGARFQRGHGLGNFFSGLKRFAAPLLKKGLEFLLPRALKTGTEIVSDVTGGKNIKESFRSRVPGAIKDAANDLLFQSGSGLRKRRIIKRRKPIKRFKL